MTQKEELQKRIELINQAIAAENRAHMIKIDHYGTLIAKLQKELSENSA